MTIATAADEARIFLPKELAIGTVKAVRRDLVSKGIDAAAAIDASPVENIDLAGLQLLVALANRDEALSPGLVGCSSQVEAAMRRAGFHLPAMN